MMDQDKMERLFAEIDEKKAQRDELARLTAQFLGKGGKVKLCTGRYFGDETPQVLTRPVKK